ncbi:MAG: hypothetical protein KAR33_12280, partial [Candidatus Thorarchaeota archaeon]|nr:hypothetical protein [Candidatus Thorarchaeota archaeon]
YEVGKSVYLNMDVTDYYGDPVDDLYVAIAFKLPNGSLSFFIAGFVENGLYSSQFVPAYWSDAGTINGIFIILREEYAGTYSSISFELYKPDTTNGTPGIEPLLNLVQVAYITSFGIFGALIYGLYWSRSRRKRRYRIPEIDQVLGQDIDNTLNTLMATISMMNELINREDIDKIQKIEALRGLMADLERAREVFDSVSERIGGV